MCTVDRALVRGIRFTPTKVNKRRYYTPRENNGVGASKGCSACAPLGVRAWTAECSEGCGSRGRAGRRGWGGAAAGWSGARAPSDRWRPAPAPAPSVKRVCIMNTTDQSDRDRGSTFISRYFSH